jgi:hypothetical protein
MVMIRVMKNMVGKVMTFMMLNCDKATFLISKKDIKPLTITENLQLKIHLMSCKYCQRFSDQSGIISNQISSIGVIDPNNLKLKLTSDQKKCMQKVIDNKSCMK